MIVRDIVKILLVGVDLYKGDNKNLNVVVVEIKMHEKSLLRTNYPTDYFRCRATSKEVT